MERTVTCASAGAAMAIVVEARTSAARLAFTTSWTLRIGMSSPPESFWAASAHVCGVHGSGVVPCDGRRSEQGLEGLFDALEGDPADLVDHGVAVHEGAHGGRDGLAVFIDREELEAGLVDRFHAVTAGVSHRIGRHAAHF